MEEVASLLALSGDAARHLADSEVFPYGPAGLRCRLLIENAHGAPEAARPIAMLGLAANNLLGDEVRRLLNLQSLLLADGLWYLGTSGEGELQIMALRRYETSRDIATAVNLAGLLGWTTLRILLAHDVSPGSAPADAGST